MSVTLRLEDDIDVSRGDLICRADDRARRSRRELEADVCWMADAPLRAGRPLRDQAHDARRRRRSSTSSSTRVDVHTLDRDDRPAELGLNDIGRVRLRTSRPLAFDAYDRNRATGAFILIDEATNDTVGGGMIVVPTPSVVAPHGSSGLRRLRLPRRCSRRSWSPTAARSRSASSARCEELGDRVRRRLLRARPRRAARRARRRGVPARPRARRPRAT